MLKYTALLWVLLLFSCKKKFEAIHPSQQKITESVYASGIVKSRDQYEVFSSVAGLVASVLVTEGDLVKKGDALIRITNTSARLNTDNARLAADYAAKNANTEKLQELKNSIELSVIQLDNADLLLKRQQNLWAQQIGSRNELDQRELAHKNAANTLEAARLRYTQLDKQIRFQEVQSAKTLAIAANSANDYTIKAENDGKVYSVLKKQGEMVNTQTAVALIGNADSFELELQVDEYDIARIRTGQQIILGMDSYKGRVYEGLVKKIEPLMNDRSKSFTIKAAFTKQPQQLYPGLTCEANIIIQQKERALTLPRSCLLEGDYVLMADKTKRKLSTGLKDYQLVEITGGLLVSDIVLKQIP
jgi:multidrug resistance efflux pump